MERLLAVLLPPLPAQVTVDPSELRVSYAPYFTSQAARFDTETRVVEVGAVVRDASGNAVRSLKRDDFSLLDDGKPRTISLFSESAAFPPLNGRAEQSGVETAARPQVVALLFDDLIWQAPGLKSLQEAALASLKKSAKQFLERDRLQARYLRRGLLRHTGATHAVYE